MRNQQHPGRPDRPQQLTLPLAYEPGARLIVYAMPHRAAPNRIAEPTLISAPGLTDPPSAEVAIAPRRQWPPRRSKVAARTVTAATLVVAAVSGVLALPQDWKDPSQLHRVSVQAAISSAPHPSRETLAPGAGHKVASAASPAGRGPAMRRGQTVTSSTSCLPLNVSGKPAGSSCTAAECFGGPSAEMLARHDLAWRRLAIGRRVARPAARRLQPHPITRKPDAAKKLVIRVKRKKSSDLAARQAKMPLAKNETREMIIDGIALPLSSTGVRSFVPNDRRAFNVGKKTANDFLLIGNGSMNQVMAFMERPERVLFATPCRIISKKLFDSMAHAQEIYENNTLYEITNGCLSTPDYGNFTRYRWPALLSNLSLTK